MNSKLHQPDILNRLKYPFKLSNLTLNRLDFIYEVNFIQQPIEIFFLIGLNFPSL